VASSIPCPRHAFRDLKAFEASFALNVDDFKRIFTDDYLAFLGHREGKFSAFQSPCDEGTYFLVFLFNIHNLFALLSQPHYNAKVFAYF